MTTPKVGEIWGNYRLTRYIAKGGFGWVFEAEQKWLKTPVAIKILETAPYRLQKDIGQFIDEAQKLQTLKHPHIVEIKDFGVVNDAPYLVMPLYQGSLAWTREQILPLPTVVAYVNQIATTLNYVHQHHIVHRDIKPENFLLGKDEEIILSDFGIATVTHSMGPKQEYAGTAQYMPPEQWQGKAVRASDQYALAMVVYEWLCGVLPFQGTLPEIMGQHNSTQPPSLREQNPEIDQEVESVVMKALAKDPAQRFQTILEFAEALEKAAKHFSLKLLLTLSVEEGETIQTVDWVWGNHYLFLVYKEEGVEEGGRMQMVDVLTGKTVFSATEEFLLAWFWEEENCTASFNEGTIAHYGRSLIDTRTGKRIAEIENDTSHINQALRMQTIHTQSEAFGQSSEGRKIAALANSLMKLDSGERCRIFYCPPQWQYVAIARINEQGRTSQIEAYQVRESWYIGKQFRSYRITEELSSGSFGTVCLGKHINLTEQPPVAIKILDAHLVSEQERDQFLREAQILRELKHPHILPLIDIGIQDGFPYFIVEYASGGSLRDRLRNRSSHPIPVEESLTILSQIGQALDYAHQHNIIHRDLKPENILFNADGNVLLADFGIALTMNSPGIQRTETVMGSPRYMAPEQFDRVISKKIDQYALGCIAYELFTGRSAFSIAERSLYAWATKHAREYPPPPTHFNSALPKYLEAVLFKAIIKDPEGRYASVLDFVTALRESPQQWLDEGNAHYRAERYQEALAAFEQALAVDPACAIAYAKKGGVLSCLNRDEEALAAHQQAVQLSPENAGYHLHLAGAWYNLKRYREAADAYEAALLHRDPAGRDQNRYSFLVCTQGHKQAGSLSECCTECGEPLYGRRVFYRCTRGHSMESRGFECDGNCTITYLIVLPHIARSRHVIGIDFGTTKSCVAVMQDGRPMVIPSTVGTRTTPSIATRIKSLGWFVGEAAQQQAAKNPENTIFSIHRFIGRKYDDPQIDRDRRLVPYKVVRASNGDSWVELLEKEVHSPKDITAKVLQQLKSDAEKYLEEFVTQAVVVVPACFNAIQRQVIQDACRMVDLEIIYMIASSTAAALAYGRNKKKDERIAVYDMGGGTFDISILELGDGVFEVKSTHGDTHLGGDDFDQRIINWLADEFRKENGIDLRQDRMALQRLREAAEKAKKELSSSMQTEVNLVFITADASGPKHLNMTLTRSKLEQLVDDLIEKTRSPVIKALSDAGVRPGDINEVVLVGGQTRMPAVQTMVRRIFDREPHRGVNPDEAVAVGAAIQAGVLTGDVKDVLLLDVTPLSLGIETLGGVFTRLVERNTTIPTQKTQVFSTASDNQPSLEISVLQGEREFAKDNLSLGSFIFDGIPSAPRGVPRIEITISIDHNGIASLSARDEGTGREKKVRVVPGFQVQPASITTSSESVPGQELEYSGPLLPPTTPTPTSYLPPTPMPVSPLLTLPPVPPPFPTADNSKGRKRKKK